MVELYVIGSDANTRQAGILDIPTQVLQHKILIYFTAKELFMLRGVCGEFSDSIKTVWCQTVKDEMLE